MLSLMAAGVAGCSRIESFKVEQVLLLLVSPHDRMPLTRVVRTEEAEGEGVGKVQSWDASEAIHSACSRHQHAVVHVMVACGLY